jgi:hypothetical protein
MSFFILANDPEIDTNGRRGFLGKSGLLLSGAAVALLAGRDALAATAKPTTCASSTPPWAPSWRRSPPINWAPTAACCKSRCSTWR